MALRQRGAKLMVSYGGKMQRCPGGGGGQERDVGGEHRLVEVSRNATLVELRSRLAAVSGFPDFSISYGFSGEARDALRRVTTEDDVRCMLDWVLHRDLRVHLLGEDPAMIRRVRVFLVRAEVLPPLIDLDTVIAPAPPVQWSVTPPPWFSTKPPLIDLHTVLAPALVQWSATPPPSSSTKPPLYPTISKRRIPSAPSLSTISAADTTLSKPPFSPTPAHAPAPAPALPTASRPDPTPSNAPPHPTLFRRVSSAPSLSATTSTDAAASSTSSTSSTASSNMADFHAYHMIMASPAPAMFLVPVAPPVIVYQSVFVVPAFSCSMV